jgi:hypothetical protein
LNVLGKQTLIYVAETQAERNESKDKITFYKTEVYVSADKRVPVTMA